jgi:hypothetical protein
MYKNEHQKWGRQSKAAKEIPNVVREIRTLAATFFTLSPSMVQPERDSAKYCE